MDDILDGEKLALLVAKDLPGVTPEEVKYEFKEAEDDPELGESKGILEIFTVAGLLVKLARVALQIWTKKTTEQQLVAALEATAASADNIDEEKRGEIIDLIVDYLNQLK